MEQQIKIRPIINKLPVGKSVTFPIEKMKSVRTQASELSMMFMRQYRTHIDRGTRTIEVTRIK